MTPNPMLLISHSISRRSLPQPAAATEMVHWNAARGRRKPRSPVNGLFRWEDEERASRELPHLTPIWCCSFPIQSQGALFLNQLQPQRWSMETRREDEESSEAWWMTSSDERMRSRHPENLLTLHLFVTGSVDSSWWLLIHGLGKRRWLNVFKWDSQWFRVISTCAAFSEPIICDIVLYAWPIPFPHGLIQKLETERDPPPTSLAVCFFGGREGVCTK